jgi:KTSC domain-containing protein
MKFPRQTTPLVLTLLALALATSSAVGDEIISRIKREPVKSSNVASAGYSKSRRALEIEFTRGAVYRFLDVPAAVYRAFLAADSKGHFIAAHLRGRYRFVRVQQARPRKKSAGGTPNQTRSEASFASPRL